MTEDEMVGWHHRLNGREFEQSGCSGGQSSLVGYSPWGCKESDTTEQLNNKLNTLNCWEGISIFQRPSSFLNTFFHLRQVSFSSV